MKNYWPIICKMLLYDIKLFTNIDIKFVDRVINVADADVVATYRRAVAGNFISSDIRMVRP